jgi:hypothetical protein
VEVQRKERGSQLSTPRCGLQIVYAIPYARVEPCGAQLRNDHLIEVGPGAVVIEQYWLVIWALRFDAWMPSHCLGDSSQLHWGSELRQTGTCTLSIETATKRTIRSRLDILSSRSAQKTGYPSFRCAAMYSNAFDRKGYNGLETSNEPMYASLMCPPAEV